MCFELTKHSMGCLSVILFDSVRSSLPFALHTALVYPIVSVKWLPSVLRQKASSGQSIKTSHASNIAIRISNLSFCFSVTHTHKKINHIKIKISPKVKISRSAQTQLTTQTHFQASKKTFLTPFEAIAS